MIVWIIFGITIFVALIFMVAGLNAHTPTQEEIMQKLAEKWHGTIEPIPEMENSFRMKFTFENQEYVYEDRESKGFNGAIYHGYLKAQTGTGFNMAFMEREKTMTVRTDITIASNISTQSRSEIILPSGLKQFRLVTSRPFWAQALLNDKKIASIFIEFQNIDQRGAKSFAIKIMDGEVVLEFSPTAEFKPNLPNLRSDPASFEGYVNKVGLVASTLRRISEDI